MRKSEFSEPHGKRPQRIFDPPVTREAEGDDSGYAIPAKFEFSEDGHAHLEKSGFVLCGFYDLLRYGPRKEFILFANALYMHPEARLKWADVGMEWNEWLSHQKPIAPSAA